MFNYAQLNEENICIGISQLSGEVHSPRMILLENQEVSLLGKKYNKGVWDEVEQPEPKPETLSPTEQAILQTAINTEYIASLMEVKA